MLATAPSNGDSLRILLSHVYSWPEVRRGGERYLHELGSALADAGHQVEVWSSSPAPGRSVVLGVPVTYFKRRHFLPNRLGMCSDEVAFGTQAAVRVIGRRRFDVWHALGTADAAAGALLGRRVGLHSVHTTLGVPSRVYRDSRPDHRLHDLVVRHVDDYVCLSRTALRALESGWGRQGRVVGGGVDVRRFAPPSRRHPHPVLLYSGSFSEPRKNLPLLLEATAILRKRHRDLELWLSGSGEIGELLRNAPSEARQAVVELGLGEETDQSGRYGSAWVTVLPSEDEAFGLCLIESLACGTPIVVLEQGGGPAEILQPGLGFASRKSADDLADACEKALDLAMVRGTTEACRTAAESYDWRRSIVPRIEAVYRS